MFVLKFYKRNMASLMAFFMPLFVFAQTQYDYYDDDVLAGGVDSVVTVLVIIVGLVLVILAIFVVAFIGNCIFEIYYWFNPEADPKYKRRLAEKRKERERPGEKNQKNMQNEMRTIPVEEKESKKEVHATKMETNEKKEEEAVHANNVSPNIKEQTEHQITRANSFPITNVHQQKVFEELHFKAPSEWELSHIGWSTDEYGVRYSNNGKILYYAHSLLFTEYEVKEGTEIICDEAFHSSGVERYSQLRLLKIPDTVKYIGNHAFCGNSQLKTIELSKNLIYIGDYSFAACGSLKYMELPESIRYLGQGCFKDCMWEKFVIPKSVECIKGNPIIGTIYKIYENDSPFYTKKNNCIYSNDYKTIIASEKEVDSSSLIGVCHIAGGAFASISIKCRFGKLNIPDTIISIGDYAFYECHTFKEIYIPNSVKTIGENAFQGCALKVISIPHSVTVIGKLAFEGCQYLTKISLPTSIKSISDKTFTDCSSLERIEIPIHVEHIGYGVFFGCGNLKEVILPEGLKSIGDYAFYDCRQLKKITIPSSVTYIGNNPFVNCRCKVKSLSHHFVIKNGLLLSSDMKTIISCLYDSEVIDIPNGVESIGERAFFNCSNIVHLAIPNTVKTIGCFAFCDCHSLKSISIPKSVQRIENSSFLDCKSLEIIRVFNKDIEIIPFQFSQGCDSLKAIQIPRGSLPHFHIIFEYESGTIDLLTEAAIKEMKEATDY